MDAFTLRFCLSLLLLTSIGTSAISNDTNHEESREPRVSGRIVKLYSGVKPDPYICSGEGFQPDPSNCAVFYRCVKERSGKFTVFRYQCAPGTVYDPDVEICNHPHSTRRSECGGMKATYTNNINEIDGAQSEVPRPISTKLPVFTEQTTLKNPTTLSWILSTERHSVPTNEPWGSSINNTPSTQGATHHITTKFSDTTTGYVWSSSTQNHMQTSPPKKTQQPNAQNIDICTSDGFMGDSENCRKFYRCVGNQRGGYAKFEFSCSESTVWDDEIQGCNHPWAVKRSKCGRSISYDDKLSSEKPGIKPTDGITKEPVINHEGYGYKSNKTIQQQLQISHGSHVTQSQTQISNSDQVIQNQTQINYGDKLENIKNSGSKQNQTQISHGTAVSQTQTQIDYGNQGVQTQLQIDHSKDSSQSQVQIQESTTTQSATSAQSNNIGNNECSESGFMGDANDCKKFYRCVDNGRGKYTKFQYFCGDGTVWDPEIEACNHAWAVKNCGSKLPSEPTNEEHIITTTKSTQYHTESTKTTQNYYTPSQLPNTDDEDDIGYGNQNIHETVSSSTTMKPVTTTTLESTITTTEKSNGVTTDCTHSGFIGDTNDCKIFYRCVDNGRGGFTKYEYKCGDGTLWDPDIEACNHAWAVKDCGGSSSSNVGKEETTTKKESTTPPQNTQTTATLIQVTTQTSTEINDYDTGYGSQNSEHSSTSTKQPQAQESNKNSQCKSSGFMGDENDCKKFYRCVDNGNGGFIRYEFTCGEGTVWDAKNEACNHAWAVEKCGGSNNVIENTETTSQSIPTTINGDTSSAHTTQDREDTNKPVVTTPSSTSSGTTGSVASNKCSNSGFMGDSRDCKKFYRCVDNGDGTYVRYEFNCGDGTVWDQNIEACNHAWAVEKCGGNSESVNATQQTTSQNPVMQDEYENGYATPNYETSEPPKITSTTSSSSVPTTSSETNRCNKSGFMGDKNDCKKFYRCVDNGKGGYDRYEFQCGEGTVWDGSMEACNHAWAVKDCGASGSSTTDVSQNESTTESISGSVPNEVGQTQQSTEKASTTTLIHHESEETGDECMQEGFFGSKNNCKNFYRCVENGKGGFIKYEFTCGEGTSWNQDIQGCDHTSPDRPCGVTSQEPTYLNDDMSSIDTQTTSTTKATASTEETENTQATKKPQTSHGTCDSEGFYQNPSDCKKFYRCVANGNGGYTKYDFNCGDGTVWNQEMLACGHESSDKACSGSSSNQNQGTEFQAESTTSSSYSTTKKQETIDKTESPGSAGKCTSEGFISHPHDCKKFIRCVSNDRGGYTQYEFSCGDGTVWVQDIQTCDHDNGVNSCSAQSGSTSKPPNTEAHSSSTSVSSMTSSTESMAPSKEDDEYDTGTTGEPSHDKTDDCTSEGYFANKQDCRKFYRCVNNGNNGYTKYNFVCGDGTAWDSDLQTCNYISEVQSCTGSSHEGNGNQESTTNKNQAETENTSSTTKSTTSSSESSSSSSSNSQDICESEGYFGDSKDCKKFYRCVDNGKGGYTKYDFTCGDGTIWDQDITTCNYPQDVSNPSCGSDQGESGSPSTTSSATTSSTQTTSSTTESSNSSQSTSDCSQESSKKPANNNVTCDKAGYYANPNDCKKFYRCVDWDGDGKRFSVFHFECGEGTIWDPALTTCNHEDSVYPQRDCSQTQSQNVGGETTTTEGTTSTATSNPTTTDQTTQESTTSEQTTTQQSTTSEQTTTQQSTTSEQITTNQSTNEQTTTQQSMTSEQTTTQQPTTSEKTTTQESTTSEQTTTQQPTTSEQTTTQQYTTTQQTTTEQTTTQQSTSSEKTTTQETITNEPSTTQQSSTSEQTTQESTTSEQTTTQQSTTSEQTTTQQSTISEQTTTGQSTNQPTTTQQSTTSEETTTQESTTSEQTTAEQSTTSEQTTTQESTTSETTTQSNEQNTEESTTTEQTTDGTITTEGTTEQSTTQISSTESDSAESSTTEEAYASDNCPEIEDDQYLLVCPTSFKRHPKYCNMFYQCTEDDETYEAKVAMFKCPNGTIYDESNTQCVTENKADKKCDGEIANKRRIKRLGLFYREPILADKGKKSCPSAGHFPFEKDSECSKGFLKCESKNGQVRGHVYQCPEGYVYWSISKRCERAINVRDCKRSTNDWTERWNIPVERKNIASR